MIEIMIFFFKFTRDFVFKVVLRHFNTNSSLLFVFVVAVAVVVALAVGSLKQQYY
jgi:hypothetical protein